MVSLAWSLSAASFQREEWLCARFHDLQTSEIFNGAQLAVGRRYCRISTIMCSGRFWYFHCDSMGNPLEGGGSCVVIVTVSIQELTQGTIKVDQADVCSSVL